VLDGVIIVADGHIEQIGPPDLVKVPRGALELRLDGKWVIPGLIDAHVHAERWALSRYLAYGITSIRSLGGDRDSLVLLREAASQGTLLGPRVYISGPMIDGRPATWPGATEVLAPDGSRRAVDDRVLLGATSVKVYTKIDRRLLEPLINEANALEMPVAAHLGRVDAVTAAAMGIHSIEHLSGVVEATVSDPARLYRAHDDFFTGWRLFERSWTTLDSVAIDRTARALAATDVVIVPTLGLHEAFGHLADQQYISRLDLDGVPQPVREAWNVPDLIRRAGLSSADFRAIRSARLVQDLFLRLFKNAGGIVAAGSDSPNQLLAPGASLHHEMQLLVAAGLSTEAALLAATRDAAKALDSDSVGILLPGYAADFVVLNADPLEDIANARLIDRIVLGGTGYHPDEFKQDWNGGRQP
jgi:imidazolonepropionase-like amidohydrolase